MLVVTKIAAAYCCCRAALLVVTGKAASSPEICLVLQLQFQIHTTTTSMPWWECLLIF